VSPPNATSHRLMHSMHHCPMAQARSQNLVCRQHGPERTGEHALCRTPHIVCPRMARVRHLGG
jgi:hypothetical protein